MVLLHQKYVDYSQLLIFFFGCVFIVLLHDYSRILQYIMNYIESKFEFLNSDKIESR